MELHRGSGRLGGFNWRADTRSAGGAALVELSVVEQRYSAVLVVERGEPKIVVAAQFEISCQTLHT